MKKYILMSGAANWDANVSVIATGLGPITA